MTRTFFYTKGLESIASPKLFKSSLLIQKIASLLWASNPRTAFRTDQSGTVYRGLFNWESKHIIVSPKNTKRVLCSRNIVKTVCWFSRKDASRSYRYNCQILMHRRLLKSSDVRKRVRNNLQVSPLRKNGSVLSVKVAREQFLQPVFK